MSAPIGRCSNRIAYWCQACKTTCCWYCDRPLLQPGAAEVKTIANRFCDEESCIAAEATEHGLTVDQMKPFRNTRKVPHRNCLRVTVTETTLSDTRFTYCSGCGSRILPGQDVVGAPAESAFDMLRHRACVDRKWLDEQLKQPGTIDMRGMTGAQQDAALAIAQATAAERAAYESAREAARPAVEERIKENLDNFERQRHVDDLIEGLEVRAHAVGAILAGQNSDEGVIDKAGKWHELENPDGSPCVGREEELAAIERILVKLEAT